MITITVSPPNKPSFSRDFSTVSDAYDFLMLLQEQGYKGAAESTQPAGEPACACKTMNIPGVGEVRNATGCPVHGNTKGTGR